MYPPFFDGGQFKLPSLLIFKLVGIKAQANKPVRLRSVWEIDHVSVIIVVLVTKVIYCPTTVVPYPFDECAEKPGITIGQLEFAIRRIQVFEGKSKRAILGRNNNFWNRKDDGFVIRRGRRDRLLTPVFFIRHRR